MNRSFIFLTTFLLVLFLAKVPSIETINLKDKSRLFNVEIRGAVKNPGIYEFNQYSIVKELLDETESLPEADLSKINQSQYLYPEMMIYIPMVNEEEDLISINHASLKELTLLPGIGEEMAERIIEYRNQKGGFNELIELMKVKGIGDKKYAKIEPFICL